LVGTSGCALWKPRVDPGQPDPNRRLVAQTVMLDAALAWAQGVRTKLQGAGEMHTSLPLVGGTILIPLTSAIIGLGITGAGGAPITALSLAGASLLGIGSWLYS